jgi:hypothetical protein
MQGLVRQILKQTDAWPALCLCYPGSQGASCLIRGLIWTVRSIKQRPCKAFPPTSWTASVLHFSDRPETLAVLERETQAVVACPRQLASDGLRPVRASRPRQKLCGSSILGRPQACAPFPSTYSASKLCMQLSYATQCCLSVGLLHRLSGGSTRPCRCQPLPYLEAGCRSGHADRSGERVLGATQPRDPCLYCVVQDLLSMHKLPLTHRHGGGQQGLVQTQRQNPLQDPWTSPDRLNSPGGLIPTFSRFRLNLLTGSAPPRISRLVGLRCTVSEPFCRRTDLLTALGGLLAGSVTDTSTYDWHSQNLSPASVVPHLSAQHMTHPSAQPGSKVVAIERPRCSKRRSAFESEGATLQTSGQLWRAATSQIRTQTCSHQNLPLKPSPSEPVGAGTDGPQQTASSCYLGDGDTRALQWDPRSREAPVCATSATFVAAAPATVGYRVGFETGCSSQPFQQQVWGGRYQRSRCTCHQIKWGSPQHLP